MHIIHRPNRPLHPGIARDSGARRNVAWRSHADVVDLGTCYEVRMTIRGLHPDRLSVEVRDEILIVVGRQEIGPYSPETGGTEFQRLIGLPADAGRLGATARREADRLVVRIPKTISSERPAVSLEVTDTTGAAP